MQNKTFIQIMNGLHTESEQRCSLIISEANITPVQPQHKLTDQVKTLTVLHNESFMNLYLHCVYTLLVIENLLVRVQTSNSADSDLHASDWLLRSHAHQTCS